MKSKLVIASILGLLAAQNLTAQVTYRVYATREGLVGNTTANGHKIVSRDHFCALPSRQALNSNGGRTYTVTINNFNNGHTAVNVPQWDVGPWNTTDNYWHLPRAAWTSLARGLPEAQAAYQNGFNGGHDEFGRSVANPAGIDLADGTFWDDLGMTGNNWVDVTYNWEAPPAPTATVTVDNSNSGFSTSANWSTGTSSTDKFGADYRYRSTAALSDQSTWTGSLPNAHSYTVSAWWPQGSNRSATAAYTIAHGATTTTATVNQQANGGKWNALGTWSDFAAGANTVKLSCWTTTGFIVVADAVKWSY